MKRRQITAFYLETLILIVVFIGIILILTRIFGMGKQESQSAKLLTNAVVLSENAAEAVSASDSPEKVLALLDINGNAQYEETNRQVTAYYDTNLSPDPSGELKVSVTWDPSPSETGTFITSQIAVWYRDGEVPIYSLDTAVFLQEVEQ